MEDMEDPENRSLDIVPRKRTVIGHGNTQLPGPSAVHTNFVQNSVAVIENSKQDGNPQKEQDKKRQGKTNSDETAKQQLNLAASSSEEGRRDQ